MSKSGLGASKTRFWTLWGTFWKAFGCSGAHFGCLWNAPGCLLGIPWASRAFLEAFEMHLGAIWELYGVDLGSICAFSTPHSDKGTPALPRFAPRSVTIRGGSQPHERVEWELLQVLEEVFALTSCLVMVCSCYSSIVIAGRGSRIPSRKGLFLLRGAIFTPFGSFFILFT